MRCLAIKSQNSTYFQIHGDCVAMETESCMLNKEFDISEGLFVYTVLLKHYEANILCFLFKEGPHSSRKKMS